MTESLEDCKCHCHNRQVEGANCKCIKNCIHCHPENFRAKEYHLVTIGDLFDVVTLENLDNLRTDIGNWLEMCANTKKAANILGADEVRFERLVWVDDGKNDKEVNIRVEGSR